MNKVGSSRLSLYLILIIFGALFLTPIYIVITTSITPLAKINAQNVWALPQQIYFGSYNKAWNRLGSGMKNSFIITLPATLISAFLGSITGYVLSKFKFRGANIIFFFIILGMFIPYQAILIPLVQFISKLHLYSTYLGLILTHTAYGIPITTLIFRNFYTTIPKVLIDAAKIDGAGIISIYRRLILPLSIPGFIVTIVWQFTSVWNDFLFALVLTRGPDVQPITLALANLQGVFSVQWNMQMAGALLAALPTLLVYIFLGRYFMRGLLAGSVK